MRELTDLVVSLRRQPNVQARIKFNFTLPKGLFQIQTALDRASMFTLENVLISTKVGWFNEKVTIEVKGETSQIADYLDYVNGRLIHIENVLS